MGAMASFTRMVTQKSFADTHVELLVDAQACASLGENAFRTVSDRFSLGDMVQGFAPAINAACEVRAKGQ